MAIKIPGKRARNGKLKSGKRSAVAVLQLTAMVDMFTVMCVFLLQNYATTNQVLPLDESVQLPAAAEVKELQPSNVVVLSEDGLLLNNVKVADFQSVRGQEDWMIAPLADGLQGLIRQGEEKKKTIGNQLRDAVAKAKTGETPEPEVDEFRKITIQAEKSVDFLTVKKVMYTVTEAGVQEINFAVLKKPSDKTVN